MHNPNFINFNPITVLERLYEMKARQDGEKNVKIVVREVTEEEARAAGGREIEKTA